jgi:hypothetical protein
VPVYNSWDGSPSAVSRYVFELQGLRQGLDGQLGQQGLGRTLRQGDRQVAGVVGDVTWPILQKSYSYCNARLRGYPWAHNLTHARIHPAWRDMRLVQQRLARMALHASAEHALVEMQGGCGYRMSDINVTVWITGSVNVGGAIALGHPLGASGARIMTSMIHHMRRTGTRFGLQTMCEGGGLANATILELVD